MIRYIDIVFDGPPSPDGCRFVEVENDAGRSISLGEWERRADGFYVIRIPAPHGYDGHASVCAVHNLPALPTGDCDCHG